MRPPAWAAGYLGRFDAGYPATTSAKIFEYGKACLGYLLLDIIKQGYRYAKISKS